MIPQAQTFLQAVMSEFFLEHDAREYLMALVWMMPRRSGISVGDSKCINIISLLKKKSNIF